MIELAVEALEARIVLDDANHVCVRLAEAHAARGFVQRGVGDDLLQHLTVEAELAGLLLGQRTAEAAADLLQPVGEQISELLRRDFGAADLGEARLAEAAEDIGDAPDAETDDQHTEHDGHHRLAEPVR